MFIKMKQNNEISSQNHVLLADFFLLHFCLSVHFHQRREAIQSKLLHFAPPPHFNLSYYFDLAPPPPHTTRFQSIREGDTGKRTTGKVNWGGDCGGS